MAFAADLASVDRLTMIGRGIDRNQRSHVIASSCLSLPFACVVASSVSPGRYILSLSNALLKANELPSSIQFVAEEACAPTSFPMALQ